MRRELIFKFNSLLPVFSLFFLFSLFVHNHPLAFNKQDNRVLTKHHNVKANHTAEFCSACRIGGKIQKYDNLLYLNNISFKSNIVTYKLILADFELIYYLAPRSPPHILS